MRVDGEWYECDDGVKRPVVRIEVEAADGSWQPALFELDTGADRTVFNAELLSLLGLQPSQTSNQLGGIGGIVSSAIVETQLRLTHDSGKLRVQAQFAVLTTPQALNMSILGQDLRSLFVFIVDWPGQVVCLLHPPHRYRIEIVA